MEEEIEEATMTPQGANVPIQSVIPPALGIAMMGEELILFGILFGLFGLANFLSGLFGIKGSGEMAIGLFMVIAGFILISKLRIRAVVRPMPGAPMSPQQKVPESPTSSYR